MSATPNAVAAYLERLEPEARRVVEALRSVVRRAVPDAEETIAWGSVSYHTPWVGGRVKGALCQISVRRGAVQLEFIHGVRLADPAGLLQGSRKSKRYVPILSPAEARRPAIVALVEAASEVEFPAPQSSRRSPRRDLSAADEVEVRQDDCRM